MPKAIDDPLKVVTSDAGKSASDVIRAWPTGHPFTVDAALQTRPDLVGRRSILVDFAYEEFCRLEELGKKPFPSQFVARFPEIERSLRRVLQLHDFCWNEPQIRDALLQRPWPTVGETFLGFRLAGEMGRGARSRVFLARDLELAERVVVLKVGYDSREAATLGTLEHSGIVPVLSARTDPETKLSAICMPFLGYGTLDAVIDCLYRARQRPRTGQELQVAVAEASQLPVERFGKYSKTFAAAVAHFGTILSAALAHAHAAGIIHSDIKPSNILIGPTGPMLLDFNLAQQSGLDESVIGGTLPYMSPEQLASWTNREQSVGPPSDIFSLGVTLYELFNGVHPYGISGERDLAGAASMLAEAHRRGPTVASAVNGRLEARIIQVLYKCLAFDSAARPTAQELARCFKSIAKQSGSSESCYRRARLTALTVGAGAIAAGFAFRLDSLPLIGSATDGVRLEANLTAEVEPLSSEAALLTLAQGWDRLQADDFQSAYHDLERAHHALKRSQSAAALGYCVLSWKRDVARALPLFQQALEGGLDTPEVHNNLGYCFLQLGDLESAETHLHTALAGSPALTPALFNLSLVDLKKAQRSDLSPDLSYIEHALSHDVQSPDLFLDTACVFAYACSTGTDQANSLRLCRKYSEVAVASGLAPQYLSTLSSYWAGIHEQAWWQELVRRTDRGTFLPSDRGLSRLAVPFSSTKELISGIELVVAQN